LINPANPQTVGEPMEYLHKILDLSEGDVVEVTLAGTAANVQLLDESNYQLYGARKPYRYYGGYVTESPYVIKAPQTGRWHLVIDLGGNAGKVRASVRVISSASA